MVRLPLRHITAFTPSFKEVGRYYIHRKNVLIYMYFKRDYHYTILFILAFSWREITKIIIYLKMFVPIGTYAY